MQAFHAARIVIAKLSVGLSQTMDLHIASPQLILSFAYEGLIVMSDVFLVFLLVMVYVLELLLIECRERTTLQGVTYKFFIVSSAMIISMLIIIKCLRDSDFTVGWRQEPWLFVWAHSWTE